MDHGNRRRETSPHLPRGAALNKENTPPGCFPIPFFCSTALICYNRSISLYNQEIKLHIDKATVHNYSQFPSRDIKRSHSGNERQKNNHHEAQKSKQKSNNDKNLPGSENY